MTRFKVCACGKLVKGRGTKCSACYSKAYRSKSHSTKGINVRLDPETRSQLGTLARKQGISMAAKIREYIEWGLENDG